MRTVCISLWLPAVLMAGLVVGCDEAKPIRASNAPEILFVDNDVADQVEIVRHVADRTTGDLLRVRTQMRNKKDEELWVDIKVIWQDRDGFTLDETNWAPFRLPGGTVEDYEIVSLRSDVEAYEMRIRIPEWVDD